MRRVGFMGLLLAGVAGLSWGVVSTGARADAPPRNARAEVFAAESLFARTMQTRDYTAFKTYIADEAIFFGGRGTMRGKAAILAGWKQFFDSPKAPFSWRPETVEVLQSGTLAHSSGPVTLSNGKSVGTFNSIWRLEPDNQWRIVFDKGCDVCDTTRTQ